MSSYREGDEPSDSLYEEFFSFFLQEKRKYLTVKDCKNAMRCLGLLITESELIEMMGQDKKTGKEQIYLDQFIAFCKDKQGKINIDSLQEAFHLYDPDNTGVVSSQELKHSIAVFKPKLNEGDIDQILSEFEMDENGNIKYADYIEKLLSAG